jgi:hypothetical protein
MTIKVVARSKKYTIFFVLTKCIHLEMGMVFVLTPRTTIVHCVPRLLYFINYPASAGQ